MGGGAGGGARAAAGPLRLCRREVAVRWALPAGEAAPGAAAEPLRCSRFVVAVGHNAAGRQSAGGGRGVSRTELQSSRVSNLPRVICEFGSVSIRNGR